MCGGNPARQFVQLAQQGLSPRVRGKPQTRYPQPGTNRSIPACAGETGAARAHRTTAAVYPRVCGGNSVQESVNPATSGLSPRVRGKRTERGGVVRCIRSIPACAGETRAEHANPCVNGVYPRVCGGNSRQITSPGAASGLSPRVRGKRRAPGIAPAWLRSIPACAGETQNATFRMDWDGVYPRVCGGNQKQNTPAPNNAGLSPRVRGKPRVPTGPQAALGSIPACAGEIKSASAMSASCRVYPRVCGGNLAAVQAPAPDTGLSPRVRGKLRPKPGRLSRGGSIPACAGETATKDWLYDRNMVYPRVCGGNGLVGQAPAIVGGLSPRVRGKRHAPARSRTARGSIPACAGETLASPGVRRFIAVYPRVCGGNHDAALAYVAQGGLSPRVRGKRSVRRIRTKGERSIPACAGETSGHS